MPLPAPSLLFRSPAAGEELALDDPVELTFDQPMDREAVEATFTVSPTIEGTLAWVDDRTVAFSPRGEWERGSRYEIHVDETAQNAEGKALQEAVSFSFATVGFLHVSEVLPAPDSDQLDPDLTVTVVFDRPVVPLAAFNQQDQLLLSATEHDTHHVCICMLANISKRFLNNPQHLHLFTRMQS